MNSAQSGMAFDSSRLPEDPQALAELSAQFMYDKDQATQGLGISLTKVGPGRASMQMTVRPDMLNGHQTCHGGFIFALADSTFAFACNSRNQATVASGCTIDYLAPGLLGDVLTADALEASLAGRTGVYDILVTNQDGKRIALFRGRSYRIKGVVVGETACTNFESAAGEGNV
ncbi:MAG: hydroxyphenylacetyl-CoA thioesterase PaaI [Paralcaligenes sp.]